MPIQNMGTLLENIVVVEAMRLFARANPSALIDFFNSFAMPPLSLWRAHPTDYGISAAQLNALQAAPPQIPPDSYQGMLRLCLQQPPGQPGTMGPNGALLCRLLGHHLQCAMRLWLNDIPNGHYGNALPPLAGISAIVQQILQLSATPNTTTVVCGEPWPDSLTQPPGTSLTDTFAAWTQPPDARVGFLDPMRYRIDNRKDGETDSSSHQLWLSLLATGNACPVISVHFTGHRHWRTLRSEIESMHADGVATGYPHTVVAHHGHYHAVCNVRSPDGPIPAHSFAVTLQQMVQNAWNFWYQATGRDAHTLHVVVL